MGYPITMEACKQFATDGGRELDEDTLDFCGLLVEIINKAYNAGVSEGRATS